MYVPNNSVLHIFSLCSYMDNENYAVGTINNNVILQT